jgi:hypothetical protein
MSCLHCLCLFGYSGVQYILCVFEYSGVQYILCCVLCLVYPILPVSLDCPFLIAPSLFSNVYIHLMLLVKEIISTPLRLLIIVV